MNINLMMMKFKKLFLLSFVLKGNYRPKPNELDWALAADPENPPKPPPNDEAAALALDPEKLGPPNPDEKEFFN